MQRNRISLQELENDFRRFIRKRKINDPWKLKWKWKFSRLAASYDTHFEQLRYWQLTTVHNSSKYIEFNFYMKIAADYASGKFEAVNLSSFSGLVMVCDVKSTIVHEWAAVFKEHPLTPSFKQRSFKTILWIEIYWNLWFFFLSQAIRFTPWIQSGIQSWK